LLTTCIRIWLLRSDAISAAPANMSLCDRPEPTTSPFFRHRRTSVFPEPLRRRALTFQLFGLRPLPEPSGASAPLATPRPTPTQPGRSGASPPQRDSSGSAISRSAARQPLPSCGSSPPSTSRTNHLRPLFEKHVDFLELFDLVQNNGRRSQRRILSLLTC